MENIFNQWCISKGIYNSKHNMETRKVVTFNLHGDKMLFGKTYLSPSEIYSGQRSIRSKDEQKNKRSLVWSIAHCKHCKAC